MRYTTSVRPSVCPSDPCPVTVTVTAEFVVRLLYRQPKCALHSQYAVRKRKGFRWRLNVAVDDRMSFSSVGRRFHARGAATGSVM